MDSGSRRVIISAGARLRETELLIARAHAIVDMTYRRLRMPMTDDPYVDWMREHEGRAGLATALTRAMADEVSARIAVSDQLMALARRLIRASRERRMLDRERPVPPSAHS